MQNVFFPLLLGIVLSFAVGASAFSQVNVSIHPNELQNREEIGSVEVEGIGIVRFLAFRQGKQVIVQALAKGEVIGKAETFIGFTQTPLFLQTPSGLKEIIILWGQSRKQ